MIHFCPLRKPVGDGRKGGVIPQERVLPRVGVEIETLVLCARFSAPAAGSHGNARVALRRPAALALSLPRAPISAHL